MKAKYLQLISDIHLDFDDYAFHKTTMGTIPVPHLWVPPLPENDEELTREKETIFIVAGDLWHSMKYMNWIFEQAKRFHSVIFVLGNHDYWKGTINKDPDKVRGAIKDSGVTNVFFLENDVFVIDNFKFVGATLWTDMNRGDPIVMIAGPRIMNDFAYIKYHAGFDAHYADNYHKVRTEELLKIHMASRKFIFREAHKDQPDQTLVVVTHMAPSYKSVAERYRITRDDPVNYFYYSNLEKEISESEIDYWFHGHMHMPVDYLINNTRVICNSRGYRDYEEYNGHNPKLIIDPRSRNEVKST